MRVRFALIAEGTSERGLVPHLEALCVRSGAVEAIGSFPDLARLPRPPGRDVAAKVKKVLELDPHLDIVFVHRDADAPDPEPRIAEIASACASVAACPRHVAVVPVQALEAWLLVDHEQIRAAVGRRSGRTPLDIPPVARVETTARPKERLKAALAAASEHRGRRLERVNQDFPGYRAILLQRLDIDGPVAALSSWQALVSATAEVIAALAVAARPRVC